MEECGLFGLDVLSEVARHLELRDVEHLACTCRAGASHGDLLYRAVAIAWWGSQFWKDARARKTAHVFRSMHHELHQMDRFERLIRLTGDAPWTEAQYRAWWRLEEMHLRRRERRASAHPPAG